MSNSIQKNILSYKKKYYLNFFVKGLILSLSLLLFAYLFYNTLEYFGRFNSYVRGFLFFSYLIIIAIVFFKWILLPLIRIFIASLQISNEDAAKQIGGFFPNISDKLLNILQLYQLDPEKNSLVLASINQKSKTVENIQFNQAISFNDNRKYLIYLIVPFFLVSILGLSYPTFFKDGTSRIVNFEKKYIPVAPFNYILNNKNLMAFKNEDFILDLSIQGEVIPENVYIMFGERKVKLNSSNKTDYTYTIKKIAKNTSFQFEAAGFNSETFDINVVDRPNIRNFNVDLDFPPYLKRSPEKLSNIGNLQVPEGTKVNWTFQTIFSDKVYVSFGEKGDNIELESIDNQIFIANKEVVESGPYEIKLQNQYTQNKEKILYHLEVIPDEFPKISVNQYTDTVLYDYMILGGTISDDYGFSDLRLFYQIISEKAKNPVSYIPISIDHSKNSQGYFFNWNIDSLSLKDSDQIEFYLEVRDNDRINGRKRTKTGTYYFRIPDKKERKEDLKKSSQIAKNQIDRSLEQAKELNEKIEELENRLKGKNQMSWQDQKLIEDLIRERQSLEEEIEKLLDLNKANNLKQEKFSELDEDLKQKVEQLQNLMEELLDEETKKLYEELSKLMEEKKDLNEIKQLLDNLDFKEENFERELERALELFKKMKFELELEQTINDLSELKNDQVELAEKTENKSTKEQEDSKDNSEGSRKEKSSDIQDIKEEQKALNESFKDIQESIEELLDLNQELEHPNPVESTREEEKAIEQHQKDALENLENKKRKKAAQSQENAAESMESLAQKMEQMQTSGQMAEMTENFNNLREIVDNLVKLSFSQEEIMDNFKSINQSDPRFIELSQKQLKIKDDAQVIEDSLISLSKRVMQISSFVTREVSEMNKYMDESVEALRERKKAQATGKQQFAMTSMNNLALLLDNTLSMMQQALANAMGIPSKGNKQSASPSMSQLQQKLNEQISELKKSGKSGRALSEELAKLAAEQERVRRMLQEEEGKLLGNDGNADKLSKIINDMEKTELELVNKRLTEQMIRRQEEILTRMLEAEDAMREQELDKDRESRSAKTIERPIPPEFEEYLKLKEKEIELLRTVPPKLNPYYKREVMEYFNRLETSYK